MWAAHPKMPMTKRPSKSQPTWTDVKAKLVAFDRPALLDLVHGLYAAHKDNQAFLHARFGFPRHAALGSAHKTRFVAPDIAKSHRVVIPDLRGMGLSEAAKTGYDLSNISEDLHQLILSLNLSRIKVVGHDWGAAAGAG